MYIPIGNDCSVSHYLRSRGLRYEAFPFDWNVTPIISALSLIENNFEGFMDFGNLQFLPPANRLLFDENGVDVKITNDVITPVVCRRYGILFPHDFSAAGPDDYENVKSKYARRIKRLMAAMDGRQNIDFIFSVVSPNDWQLEQYKLTGMTFKKSTETEIRMYFKMLQLKNVKIHSLNRLKWSSLTWKQCSKLITERMKRIFP